MQWYGIDWTGPIATSEDVEEVVVPEVDNPLPDYLSEVLLREIDNIDDPEVAYIAAHVFVHAYTPS